MAHYDPWRVAVVIPPFSSLWVWAHEFAHQGQHYSQTLPWRAWMLLRSVPLLGWTAVIAVEIEASVMATAEMVRCGLWRPRDGLEALSGVLSYIGALFSVE